MTTGPLRVAVVAVALAAASCGYRPVHGAEPERLRVALASSSIPDAVATDEVVAGVRESLARAGALEPGEGYPRCEIEVLRADEAAAGVEAVENAEGTLVPLARATRVGVVARAFVVRAPGAPPERDTGDVRAMETVAVAGDAKAATVQHTDALRAAGRRAGRRLGARLLGLPSASED